MFDDLLHDAARHVNRHGEADPDVAASRGKDSGVDADELSAHVDQRAARIARIDRRIGLDEILVALLADTRATEGAHKPRCHGLPEAEWIADRNHEVTDFEAITVAQRDALEGLR